MTTRTVRLVVAATVLLVLGLGALTFTPTLAQTGQRCFPETGFCISGRIREFWEQNGGLPVFGLPITPQRLEATASGEFQAQWFERARLELHPENRPPYDVLLGRLGADRLVQQGRDWFAFPKADPALRNRPDCLYFAETGHAVCGLFRDAYRRFGLSFPGVSGVSFEESLALFGQPLSEPQIETLSNGYTGYVQWFERARFEYHPENQAPYNVLFGRLGAEILDEYLNPPVTPTPAPPTPTPGIGPGGCTPRMSFVRDVSVPNGTVLQPGASFIRTWRVRNDGTCYWDNYRLIFSRGDQLGGPASVAVPFAGPGASIDLSVPMVAPTSPGTYRGFWLMQAENGVTFEGLVAEITVAGAPSPTPTTTAGPTANTLTGTVGYLSRIALAPQAIVIVELVDLNGTAPRVIASTEFAAAGRQPPLPFTIPVDRNQIDPRGTYGAQARITIDGQVYFISSAPTLVLTQGRPANVDLILEQVR